MALVTSITDIIEEAKTFRDFVTIAQIDYDLQISENLVSGKRCALICCPDNEEHTSIIQDECSLVIVSEHLDIIGASFEKVYPQDDIDYGLHTGRFPLIAEEWLPGIQVVVSKFNHTYLLSTKNDIHGSTKVGGVRASTAVLNYINRMPEILNLDRLFDFPNAVSWIFQVVPVPKGGTAIVLLSVMDLCTMQEFSKEQTDALAMKFGLTTPSCVDINSEKGIPAAIATLHKGFNGIRGVILRDSFNTRISVPIDAKVQVKGRKGVLFELADNVLHGVENSSTDTHELTEVMKTNLKRMINEMSALYELNRKIRTKKKFVEGVSHYPFSKVLYGLKDGKINCVNDLHKIISPSYFLKVLKKVSGEALASAFDNCKEKLCQQKK